MRVSFLLLILSLILAATSAVALAPPEAEALIAQAKALFGPLPADAPNPENPTTAEKIDLGRKLYYDARLSKNHDVSCNTCHLLDAGGVDGAPTSTGHRGQKGGRNAPTVYNAALHVAQFWDGREPDVERQALGPPLNPIEMAMPDAAAVERVLRSIPGYRQAFAKAFPGEEQPISYANMGRAIGAFERGLLTPAPIDAFMAGDASALDPAQQQGLATFVAKGCPTCHNGPLFGGSQYRVLGQVHVYETADQGRFEVTGVETDRRVFKVPSLRNIARTGPWFHDGQVATLDEAIRLMAWHQLGLELGKDEIASIATFVTSLNGSIDEAYVARPALPESGPETPAPDPS